MEAIEAAASSPEKRSPSSHQRRRRRQELSLEAIEAVASQFRGTYSNVDTDGGSAAVEMTIRREDGADVPIGTASLEAP